LRYPCVCCLFHVFYQDIITSNEGRDSQVYQHANLHRSSKAFESLHGQKYACLSLQCRSRLFSKRAIARWFGSWIPPPPQSYLHSWNLGLGAYGVVAEEGLSLEICIALGVWSVVSDRNTFHNSSQRKPIHLIKMGFAKTH
jgi:hypothetical protein